MWLWFARVGRLRCVCRVLRLAGGGSTRGSSGRSQTDQHGTEATVTNVAVPENRQRLLDASGMDEILLSKFVSSVACKTLVRSLGKLSSRR